MKYVLILLAALAFFGCEDKAEQYWDETYRIYKIVDVDSQSDFSIFCDRSTNIAYLRYWQSDTKNGFTVYYNRDGQPARCTEIRKVW